MTQQWVYRRNQLARDGWEAVADPDTIDGWQHTGLRVAQLAGDELALEPGTEKLIVPLAGSFTVQVSENGADPTVDLAGRASVFSGPTDVLYLSTAASARLTGTGRVAVATSPTEAVFPTRYLAAAETPIELRGAGTSSRQVHNFGAPEALEAARFIVCEVITPAGNWSSYPPHKHDEHIPGKETNLEEIYYFETGVTRGGTGTGDASFGMFATYSSSAGEIEIDAMVRTGDVALVPYGYHGPAVAAPGYDLYYLNVMAGPDPERAWRITDDPGHAWIRDTWADQDIDPRLPYGPETPHP